MPIAATIRPAIPSDVEAIFALVRGLAEYERLAHAVTGSPETLRTHLFGDRPFAEVLLAESDGRAVGFALPVDWLAAWVRGAPHGDGPHAAVLDAAGRVSVLRQNGWEIVYAYADADARRPSRLRLAYPEVEVAIVIDRWRQ